MPLPPGRSRLLRRHVLAPDERVLLEMHPSKWWYFFWPAVAALVLVVVEAVLQTRAYRSSPSVRSLLALLGKIPYPAGMPSATASVNGVVVALFVVVGLWAAIEFVRWINQTYVVTDSRLIEQIGIVRHTIQEIPMRQIRDVIVYQKTLIGRLLRYGNLQFKTLLEADQQRARAMAAWAEDHFDPRGTFWFDPLRPDEPMGRREQARRAGPSGEELPKIAVEQDSGVEWWIGIPNPFLIERTVEGFLRSATAGPTAA